MDKITLQSIAQEVLAEAGWTPLDSTAIALKSFETAVGLKEAHVYLSRGDGFNFTLYGDYQSEGRNALEPRSMLIPVDADSSKVRELVMNFSDSAQAAVDQTYARGLLLNQQTRPVCRE